MEEAEFFRCKDEGVDGVPGFIRTSRFEDGEVGMEVPTDTPDRVEIRSYSGSRL